MTDNKQIERKEELFKAEAAVNREHKDRVFRLLFNDRKNLMELYNALNKTNYTDENDLIINTLDNAIFMSMKNDLSFIIDSDMCLYEHQSTICPNMPLRGLFYLSELYKGICSEKRLYSSTLIKIPVPHYIVFYNGTTNTEDVTIQRLSDAFMKKGRESSIEVTAKLININYGHNKELMESCHILRDYAYFISKLRYYMADLKGREDKAAKYKAVNMAIDDCIKRNVLKGFLTKYRAEVTSMSIFEYDEEEAKEVFREDGRIEGRAEGKLEGKTEGALETKKADILELLENKGEVPQSVKEKLSMETDIEVLKSWFKLAVKSGSIADFENGIIE